MTGATAILLLLLAPQSTGSQAPAPAGPAQPAASALQGPLFGSVPSGTPTATPLPLSLGEAIDRALQQNLGLLLADQNVRQARGTHQEALSDVLPHVFGRASAIRQKINLEAFGFTGFPGIEDPVIGPFNVFDARVFLTEDFDLKNFEEARAESHRVEAARWSYQDTRDLVVLVAGNLYLRALSDRSRIDETRAELATARALHQQAVDRKAAGLVPGIDVLRAEVELRSREARVIDAETRFARSKLDLARAIGLPLGQDVQLTDPMPEPAPTPLTVEQAVAMAFENRADWKAALSRVSAAEAARRAAVGEALPGVSVNADYGAIGQDVGGARNTYTLAGAVRVPVFEGGKAAGRKLAADAALKTAQASLEDLRGRVDYDVRTATLELKAAADRHAVAVQARELATEQLRQAQDRFAAGVANNLDVVQAQQALATAQEDVISSVFDVNFARAGLGRAVGMAEQGFRQLVRGQ